MIGRSGGGVIHMGMELPGEDREMVCEPGSEEII